MERKATGRKMDFTTIYIKRVQKLKLDELKVYHKETYGDIIQRLIDRRDFDVVNGQIVTEDMEIE